MLTALRNLWKQNGDAEEMTNYRIQQIALLNTAKCEVEHTI
jgi:hypothetical protein